MNMKMVSSSVYEQFNEAWVYTLTDKLVLDYLMSGCLVFYPTPYVLLHQKKEIKVSSKPRLVISFSYEKITKTSLLATKNKSDSVSSQITHSVGFQSLINLRLDVATVDKNVLPVLFLSWRALVWTL